MIKAFTLAARVIYIKICQPTVIFRCGRWSFVQNCISIFSIKLFLGGFLFRNEKKTISDFNKLFPHFFINRTSFVGVIRASAQNEAKQIGYNNCRHAKLVKRSKHDY